MRSSLPVQSDHTNTAVQQEGLLRVLSRTPSADNSQPWTFGVSPTEFRCRIGARSGLPDPFGPTGHATLIAGGAMHESLDLLRSSNGSNFPITVDKADGGWTLIARLDTPPDCTTASASALLARHTNRLPFLGDPVTWLPAEPASTGAPRIRVLTDPSTIDAIASATRLCSEARFNCHELHNWLFASLRWNEAEAASGDGLDIATLALPPGGRALMSIIEPWATMQALNKLGLYRVMAVIDSNLVAQAPAIVSISGGSDAGSIWDSGRSLLRTWAQLNSDGYAVHPYYVVPDLVNRMRDGRLAPQWHPRIRRAESLVREACGLTSDEVVHILLRVGRPKRAAIRSRRLPIASLLQGA